MTMSTSGYSKIAWQTIRLYMDKWHIGQYSSYLSGYICRGSSIQIHTSGTNEMDKLAVGCAFEF